MGHGLDLQIRWARVHNLNRTHTAQVLSASVDAQVQGCRSGENVYRAPKENRSRRLRQWHERNHPPENAPRLPNRNPLGVLILEHQLPCLPAKFQLYVAC